MAAVIKRKGDERVDYERGLLEELHGRCLQAATEAARASTSVAEGHAIAFAKVMTWIRELQRRESAAGEVR